MRVVVVVPLFNHAGTIVEVLDSIRPHCLPIIVVDDGSSDDGAVRVQRWMEHQADCELIRLPKNQGKARALLAGLTRALERGHSHALTIDADGQHDASRIPAFLDVARGAAERSILVLGCRAPLPAVYPLARLCGRTLSGLAVRAASGLSVGDAACGMRLWPIARTLSTPARGGRYAWEEEMIIRLAWGGATTAEVTIPVIYRPHSIGPSHYRFSRDWPEGTAVLAHCVLRRCLDPRVPWDARAGSCRTLWWPIAAEPSLLYARLLALIATAMGCLGVLPWPWSDADRITPSIVTAAIAFAAWRTRAPILAVAAGAACGWVLPPGAGLAFAVLLLLAIPCLIARERSRRP
jgi:hypothetical protein